MYGRYTKDLSEYAKDEARRLKQLERQRKKDDRARNKVDMMILFLIFVTMWHFSSKWDAASERAKKKYCRMFILEKYFLDTDYALKILSQNSAAFFAVRHSLHLI